jgi:competence protein ComGC
MFIMTHATSMHSLANDLIMRPTPIRKSEGFTRFELIAVVVIIFLLLLVFNSMTRRASERAVRNTCVFELKNLGIAYGLWAGDHHGRFPMSESLTNGGWKELLTNADEGLLCWTNYAIMGNELGQSPAFLRCPSDERHTGTNFVSNTNFSFFVGVSANASQPRSLLAGDRNLGGGATPDREYGFSPESGQGNDVAIQTNAQAGPVCWSLKMHSRGNSAGAGNILVGDGRVQQVSTLSFRTIWQPVAGLTTNWPAGHVPSSPSIRVLFP